MKRALVIGLNDYPGMPLGGCANDANAIAGELRKNGDNSRNFDIKLATNAHQVTIGELRSQLRALFASSAEVALFYFAGHGAIAHNHAYLCTSDYTPDTPGLRMDELMQIADEAQGRIRNRIILLDCCFAGNAGNHELFNNTVSISVLSHGTTILTASRETEPSMERNGHGLFTYLMLDALRGGAADILGRITPASVYSHIDQSLGAWEQRPLFKSHVDSFLVLRQVEPKISVSTLRKLPELFPNPWALTYPLSPDHEHTSSDGSPRTDGDPKLQAEFRELQDCNRVGLVVPVGAKDMYWAAMNSESCRLTPLGQHYRRLADDGRI